MSNDKLAVVRSAQNGSVFVASKKFEKRHLKAWTPEDDDSRIYHAVHTLTQTPKIIILDLTGPKLDKYMKLQGYSSYRVLS